MKKTFVTLLASPDYLKGVLVIWSSLKLVNSQYGLLVIVSYDMSDEIHELFTALQIEYIVINPIKSPYHQTINHSVYNTYSKLEIFNLTKYEKIVYLDSDMLVCRNIDVLFTKPMMSAVNTGGALPCYKHWVDLNSGLLVVEPKEGVYKDLIYQKDIIQSDDMGDQGLLHKYYSNWPKEEHLHLDHTFNMCVSFIEEYTKLFGYTLPNTIQATGLVSDINVLHFWADLKPWFKYSKAKNDLEVRAYALWQECYKQVLKVTNEYLLS
ncbi:glycosyltransferase [Spirosoma jeollabukense]